MPRPPSPQNEKNPLRILRTLLSERGEKSPLTVAKLSEIIGVPANTIRAIQNDQRKLTKKVADQVVLSTGAVWREEKAQWIYAVPADDNTAFSFGFYLEFRKIMAVRPATHRSDVEALIQDVYGLFETIPDQLWHALWFRFSDFIQDRKAEIEALPKPPRKETKRVVKTRRSSGG
jgi:hypothetical protein